MHIMLTIQPAYGHRQPAEHHLLLHITNPKAIRLLICLRTWLRMVQLCKNNNEYLRDVLDSLAYWTPDYQELRNSSVFR